MKYRGLQCVEKLEVFFSSFFPSTFFFILFCFSFSSLLMAANQEPLSQSESAASHSRLTENFQEFDDAATAPSVRRLTSGGLDLDEMQRLIQEAYPKIETAEGKNIVLVLGNLGAGKSSAVNYLLGCEMERVQGNTGYVAVPKEGQYAPASMGQESFIAETLFPEVYASDASPYFYCDCPGFEDNRTIEERICASIGTQMAINKAASVKVMIVIDNNSFNVDRAASFRKLSDTLGKLFSRLDGFGHENFPFLFAINKAESWIRADGVVASIRKIISAENSVVNTMLDRVQGRLGLLPKDRKQEIRDKRAMVDFLEFMLQGERNMHVIDVFDNPGHPNSSKSQIEAMLSPRDAVSSVPERIPAIDKGLFDFERYDDKRVKFNEAIYKIVEGANDILRKKREIPQRVRYYERMIEDAGRRVEFYDSQLASGNFAVTVNGEKIEEVMREIRQKGLELGRLIRRMSELNITDPVRYWSYPIREKRFRILGLWANPLGWTEAEVDYEGLPFVDVQESTYETGEFKDVDKNKGEGRYSSKYSSYMGKDARADVEILISSNKQPGVASAIGTLQDQINAVNAHINMLRNLKDQYEQEDTSTTGQRREEFERGMRRFQGLKRMFEQSRNVAQELIPQIEQDYEDNANLIRTTYQIVESLEFKSPLTDDFKSLYERLGDRVDPELPLSPGLFDIISYAPLIDPVQTKCGHPFNRLEVTAWLQSGHRDCPTCRAPVREIDLIAIPTLAALVEDLLRV